MAGAGLELLHGTTDYARSYKVYHGPVMWQVHLIAIIELAMQQLCTNALEKRELMHIYRRLTLFRSSEWGRQASVL